MIRDDETEVLVVGAGPVGLLAALALAQAGMEVKIIDEEERTATHSYACALHAHTLKLLDQVGLAGDALQRGRRIETIAFYEDRTRRAQIDLSKLDGDFRFVLVLPQSALEDLLEQSLARQAGIHVDWNHRLADLRMDSNTITATIDKRYETVTGYIVPHWEWVVQKTLRTRARFVVGADGHNSLVRQRLSIPLERVAGPEVFAVYEFESDAKLGHEMCVVLGEHTSNVLWPISESCCRWSFQLTHAQEFIQFPRKDRMAVHAGETAIDEEFREEVRRFVQKRAPWFEGTVKEIDWFALVQFEHRLASRFGQDNCWLAGDAAHQTGPVGMQSMNLGLNEALQLSGILKRILRESAPLTLLEAYNRDCRDEWQKLLGMSGGLLANEHANPWTKLRSPQILPCIPASSKDLTDLVAQLGLDFQSNQVSSS
jgi:2-polyprenyl-6-methoxyphenol hydroxylase-like FAD-dependent oxidoreductase